MTSRLAGSTAPAPLGHPRRSIDERRAASGRAVAPAGVVLAVIIGLAGCEEAGRSGDDAPPVAGSPTAAAPVPAADGAVPGTEESSASTGAAPIRPPDLSPLANLIDVSPGVLSGGMPRGDAGFSGLAGLGVRTIISVDAAAPDTARAEASGMRYVHVPVRYGTVTEAEQAAVARAIAEAEGTVYVHCHHGKHRGPAAVAAALRCLDRLSEDEAESFLVAAGTSPRYPGLWEAVRKAGPRDAATLLALAPVLPARAEPATFVVAMADLDRHWDNLRLLAARDWVADPEHPDLVATAEAGIVADLFRSMAEQIEAKAHGRGFVAELQRSADLATQLEAHLDRAAPDRIRALEAFGAIGESCTSCHRAFRDTEG